VADLPTQRDLFAAGRREAILSPTRFTRSIIDTTNSDINIVLNVAAAMGEEVAAYVQAALNALTLSNATEEDLDRLVYDLYQLRRHGAQAAVATLSLSRVVTTSGLTIPAGSAFSGLGATFTTQASVSFAAGNPGPILVTAVADRTGPDGNLPAGAINNTVTAFSQTVLVTNPQAAAGGRDQETDVQLRDRARDFFITARRGTRAAIEFGALQVSRVVQATAEELFQIANGHPALRVALYVADANGQANAAMAAEVTRSLDEYRALGVPVQAIAAVPQYVNITATGIQFAAGADTEQVLASATQALLALVNSTPPGATLYRTAIQGTLAGVSQLIVPATALTAPAGDLVPSTGTVIRTTADRITLTS
jgi:uncharacterized phage protein gp47/JayE